jgi:hypothetical protein
MNSKSRQPPKIKQPQSHTNQQAHWRAFDEELGEGSVALDEVLSELMVNGFAFGTLLIMIVRRLNASMQNEVTRLQRRKFL